MLFQDGGRFLCIVVHFCSKLRFFKAEEERRKAEEPRAVVAEREVSATFRVPVEVETIFSTYLIHVQLEPSSLYI